MTIRARAQQIPGRTKLEREYSLYLEALKRAGEIIDWRHEPMSLRLGANTFYIPDFLVIQNNMEAEFHETKGRWRQHDRVKIKVAVAEHPYFKFKAIMKDPKEGWKVEEL